MLPLKPTAPQFGLQEQGTKHVLPADAIPESWQFLFSADAQHRVHPSASLRKTFLVVPLPQHQTTCVFQHFPNEVLPDEALSCLGAFTCPLCLHDLFQGLKEGEPTAYCIECGHKFEVGPLHNPTVTVECWAWPENQPQPTPPPMEHLPS